VVIQAGGGIHGHPEGTVAGAVAMRQAVDATVQGKPLEEYAKTHKELALALNLWKN
jgi:ribulose-bisphosphate carboxylase large chain